MSACCPNCGAKMVEYRHSLGRGLMRILGAFYDAGSGNHRLTDVMPERNMVDNFQKLRYWGLVTKTQTAGVWRLTDHGRDFVEGRVKCSKVAVTYRGDFRRYEGEPVDFSRVPASYKKEKEYAADATPAQ